VLEGLAVVGTGAEVAVSVEHPGGEFTVQLRIDGGRLAGCGLLRTARLLFDGHVLSPLPQAAPTVAGR
jgi:4-oxalomesaconate tautomerase